MAVGHGGKLARHKAQLLAKLFDIIVLQPLKQSEQEAGAR